MMYEESVPELRPNRCRILGVKKRSENEKIAANLPIKMLPERERRVNPSNQFVIVGLSGYLTIKHIYHHLKGIFTFGLSESVTS